MEKIFLKYNVPSSKNSKIKTSKGIFHSPTVRRYLQKIGVKKYSVSKKMVEDYKTRDNLFKDAFKHLKGKYTEPFIVGFHFVRDSKRKFDFHNAVQIVADLMVAHNVIRDDDMTGFIPFPYKIDDKWYSINKEKPGVYIVFMDSIDNLTDG